MKEIIILMGGPGCGKGTIAGILREHRDMNCIEMGVLFRALPNDSEIARSIAAGNLAPDDEVFKLIESRLDKTGPILLDGFPRTLTQAEWFIKNYADKNNIKIIYLNTPTDIMKQRIKKRHAAGSGRSDDCDESIIENRIQNFQKQTAPALEFLQNCPHVQFIDIDASGELEKYAPLAIAVLNK